MTDTSPLATRIEGAAEGSRELDEAIAVAIGTDSRSGPIHPHHAPRGIYNGPHYTTSIDAALTLLPKGFIHAVWYPDDGVKVQAWQRGKRYCGFGVDIPEATAATYALALCAAALRAQALAEKGV